MVKLVRDSGRWGIIMVRNCVLGGGVVETGTRHEENEKEGMRGWLAGIGSPGHRQSNL